MVRKNTKTQLTSYENSIKKSNELSMAKLNHGLSLNQMQLLAFSIYCTQQNGLTEFNKADFEKKFKLTKYNTQDAKKDADKITSVKFSTEDLENEKFSFWNVFMGMEYNKGHFTFEWNPKMIPHILELKEKYITTDLTIASEFRSSFSWTLYDYIKAHHGYWHKPVTKESLMKLFGVENKKTYLENTGRFKKTVLDVAISELNKVTELEVWYKEKKEGRTIVGFDLHWSSGVNVISATKKQINELGTILDAVFDDVYKYVDLKDEVNRQKAIEIVRNLEEIRILTVEPEPICITKERADFLIQQANASLKELEYFFEINQSPQKKVTFYNWLEERE